MIIIGSNHLISQTGWHRCNVSLSLSSWIPTPSHTLSLSRSLQALLGDATSLSSPHQPRRLQQMGECSSYDVRVLQPYSIAATLCLNGSMACSMGFAKACPGSTCISLCGWKGVILSLSFSLSPVPCAGMPGSYVLLGFRPLLGVVAASLSLPERPYAVGTPVSRFSSP